MRGKRYTGNSSTKFDRFFLNTVFLSVHAANTATATPMAYTEKTTKSALSGNMAATMIDHIANFAPHEKNGISINVSRFSFSLSSIRVPIMAGTEHPKPISIGKMALPDNPNRRRGRSIRKATRAI